MSSRVRGHYTGTMDFENQTLEFTAVVWGKPYYFPERRVPGNPGMIESFEESGINIEDFDLDELYISGTQVNLAGYDISKPLEDAIFGELEDLTKTILNGSLVNDRNRNNCLWLIHVRLRYLYWIYFMEA